MKLTRLVLSALFTLQGAMAADIAENERLGNVMGLLADASSTIVDLSKKAPATLEGKDFGRAISRCGGADFLFRVINEKKGAIVDGKFTAGELTPGKFLTAEGEEQAAMVNRFSDLLNEGRGLFDKIKAELTAQAGKAAAERDFRPLKRILADVDSLMKKAHTDFKPPHP